MGKAQAKHECICRIKRSVQQIGVMYAPQDNGTPVRDSKKIYESINKEIQEAREHKQQVILLGDFNAKVGTTMQDNKEVLTKGMLLLK